jgi:hypothetical protein
MMKTHIKILLVLITFIFLIPSCITDRSVIYSKKKVPGNSSIALIVDCPSNIMNAVLSEFLRKKFRVKAVNSSDFYTLHDVYDIKDFKKVSYKIPLNDTQALLSMEKAYNNIYKLHIYNFEINKLEMLKEMREKWEIDYLILLELKDWQEVSWGRVIDLNTFELVWVENYPARYNDNLESVLDHFIQSISGT